jgi:hypothetical protein
VYVYLNLTHDMSHPKSQVHRDPLVEALVEELKDRVAFLERALDRRGVEAERYRQIVAGLTQTNTQQLQPGAPQEPPESPQSGEEEGGRIGRCPPGSAGGTQQGAERAW